MIGFNFDNKYHVINLQLRNCILSTNDKEAAITKAKDAALVTGHNHRVIGDVLSVSVSRTIALVPSAE